MTKIMVVLSVFVVFVGVLVFSVGVALAEPDQDSGSKINKFSSRLAEILGLESSRVDEAVKQARRELAEEGIQSKLNELVETGVVTQEQADEKYSMFQSKLGEQKANWKRFHGKSWHSQKKKLGASDTNTDDISKKLKAQVEAGEMTGEEARAKLRGMRMKVGKGFLGKGD